MRFRTGFPLELSLLKVSQPNFSKILTTSSRRRMSKARSKCSPTALDKPKASRVIDWNYKGDGPAQLVRALHQHRELPVQGVLQVLAKRLY